MARGEHPQDVHLHLGEPRLRGFVLAAVAGEWCRRDPIALEEVDQQADDRLTGDEQGTAAGVGRVDGDNRVPLFEDDQSPRQRRRGPDLDSVVETVLQGLA
ncbi:MAG: hypothetical protein V9G19_05515 [Tetrasphaera sp.]